VVFDKTGTLTQGSFTVTGIQPQAGVSEDELLDCAALCEAESTHPIARSVTAFCNGRPLPMRENVQELAGMGICVTAENRRYLAGNRRLLAHFAISVPEEPAVPGTLLYLARDGHFLGTLHITDTLKSGVPVALEALRRTGVRQLMLLSGDRQPAVEQLAQQLALDDWRAGLLPQDKLAAFEELCRGRGPHIYVGDGINDAPLLARADVGIAMGGLGSDAAVEAADCVLMRDDIGSVALALRCAVRTRRIVRQNIVFALAAKAAVLIAAALGYAPMWLAVFADVGVALLCVLNAVRALKLK
jgi:Cd2+/Zn2+-exporting ATPase